MTYILPFCILSLSLLIRNIFIKIYKNKIKMKNAKQLKQQEQQQKHQQEQQQKQQQEQQQKQQQQQQLESIDKDLKNPYDIPVGRLAVLCLNIIILLYYIDLARVSLLIFPCRNVGDNLIKEIRLIEDYSVVCLHSNHLKWIGLVIIGLSSFGIGFPIYLFFTLYYYYKKGMLKNKEVKFQFGYFFYVYKERYFYWDVLVLIRRFSIIFVNVFFYSNVMYNREIYPLTLIFMILLISLFIQVESKPFAKNFEMTNILEKYSIISLMVTVFFAQIFMSQSFTGNNLNLGWRILLIIFVSSINLAYIVIWIKEYSKSVASVKIKALQSWISKKK